MIRIKKRFIIIIFSIIILLLLVFAIIKAFIFQDSIYDYNITIKTDYSKSDIINMFAYSYKKYDISSIDDENISYFNGLLNYVDELVGKGQYSIDKIYPTNYKDKESFIAKIVINKYLDKYYKWSGFESTNPYVILFKYDNNNKRYSSDYYSFKLGMEYEKEVINELSKINNNYKYIVDFNPLLRMDSETLGVTKNSSWKSILNKNSRNITNNRPTIMVIGDSSKDLGDMELFVKNNKKIFKEFYIQSVEIIQLKENTSIIDEDSFNPFSDEIKAQNQVIIDN